MRFETEDLNTTESQMELTDIYGVYATTECTFFSSEHATFPMIDYMLVHKTNVNKFKRLKLYHLAFLTIMM